MALRKSIPASLSAFTSWLALHPVDGDERWSGAGVRYRVARYCDYLSTNPWSGGDPLADATARAGAVSAYLGYMETFGASAAPIGSILESLDRFYVFLGLGPGRSKVGDLVDAAAINHD
jgi:hypothetical protein